MAAALDDRGILLKKLLQLRYHTKLPELWTKLPYYLQVMKRRKFAYLTLYQYESLKYFTEDNTLIYRWPTMVSSGAVPISAYNFEKIAQVKEIQQYMTYEECAPDSFSINMEDWSELIKAVPI